MKKFFYLLSLILLPFLISTCIVGDGDSEPPKVADIETVNIDNYGENFIVDQDPAHKEAYIIGIKYLSSSNYIIRYSDIRKKAHTISIVCSSAFCGEAAGSELSGLFQFAYSEKLNQYATICLLVGAPDPGTYDFDISVSIDEQVLTKTLTVTLI